MRFHVFIALCIALCIAIEVGLLAWSVWCLPDDPFSYGMVGISICFWLFQIVRGEIRCIRQDRIEAKMLSERLMESKRRRGEL